MIIPFTGEFSELKNSYKQIVENNLKKKRPLRNLEGKTYNIKYHVNLLPRMGENYALMMEYMGDLESIELFDTTAVKTLIEFKWNQYAKSM